MSRIRVPRLGLAALRGLALAIASSVVATAVAAAVEYPVRPIQNIIPFSAGGGTDIWNRRLMEEMSKHLNQTVVSSNMTGGSSGSIAVEYCWKARHDGYTLCGTADGTVTIPVMTGSKLTTRDWRYFVAAGSPALILVNKQARHTTMEEILQALREEPGSLSIGGTGGGLWFANAQVMLNHGGYEMQWIPYDGSAAALKGAVSGEIDVLAASAGETQDFVRAGDLIPLAVLDTEPWVNDIFGTVLPITTWMPETGPYYPIRQWLGFMVPNDVDPEILDVLEDAFATVMASDVIRQFAEEQMCVLYNLSGEAAQEFVRVEEARMCWTLHEMGQTTFSPEDFGIQRP
ncbi:MAG: tripartite tricarboxylate transporter substrate binding protein [Planctomycetes bacterium]|nr:tripartite tricarboxylate transporter substrate binding protein [Planctomycetota bacterium]